MVDAGALFDPVTGVRVLKDGSLRLGSAAPGLAAAFVTERRASALLVVVPLVAVRAALDQRASSDFLRGLTRRLLTARHGRRAAARDCGEPVHPAWLIFGPLPIAVQAFFAHLRDFSQSSISLSARPRRRSVLCAVLRDVDDGSGSTDDRFVVRWRSGLGVLVHGGAGEVPHERRPLQQRGCSAAAHAAWDVLKNGGNALDAVQLAVQVLEDDPHFNAGTGASLTADGTLELDAALDGGPGAARRRGVRSRSVQESDRDRSRRARGEPPRALRGRRRRQFRAARPVSSPVDEASMITQAARDKLRRALLDGRPACWNGGTVGAVARDRRGSVAAATSTGGIAGKRSGRVGDSPVLGAGTYADDRCGRRLRNRLRGRHSAHRADRASARSDAPRSGTRARRARGHQAPAAARGDAGRPDPGRFARTARLGAVDPSDVLGGRLGGRRNRRRLLTRALEADRQRLTRRAAFRPADGLPALRSSACSSPMRSRFRRFIRLPLPGVRSHS